MFLFCCAVVVFCQVIVDSDLTRGARFVFLFGFRESFEVFVLLNMCSSLVCEGPVVKLRRILCLIVWICLFQEYIEELC